ncbi:hypothetical protein KKF84_02450 [Myxococcota bacterium]|nr:hypothetical protein [Myxococcota bacterium]
MDERQIKLVKRRIYVHPRVQFQNLPTSSMDTLLEKMPGLHPFPGRTYTSLMFILDWDHRLPSRRLFGRMLAFYSAKSEQRALREYRVRFEEIKINDKFPEFDVGDFDDILADESYIYLYLPSGFFRKVQLISPWRHTVNEKDRLIATGCVEKSEQYAAMFEQFGLKCGPLRIVGWVPPCTSGLEKWTVDVRFVTYCEGSSIWGKTFLTDPVEKSILGVTDFNMRV